MYPISLSFTGHTYCSSCVDKLIDDAPTCPECRYEFEFDEVRRLFIKPSASNNSSGSQAASRSDDQDGFIKQAKHIARRLQKLNATSSAQSVKTAADVIEHVAIIQCKEAQARPLAYISRCYNVSITGNHLERRARILAQTGRRL
jgi:predicted amidophosphoribosyltransferase